MLDTSIGLVSDPHRKNSGSGEVVILVATRAKQVIGGLLTSGLVWHEVEVRVYSAFCCCPANHSRAELACVTAQGK